MSSATETRLIKSSSVTGTATAKTLLEYVEASVYHLNNSLKGGNADVVVGYGTKTDQVFVGDWNGDGKDTLAVRRGNVFHLKNSLKGGNADVVAKFGNASDKTIFVGDKKDTLGLRR